MRVLIIMCTLMMATLSFASTKSTKVIYGDDNRVDVYASTNSMYVELSKSTAAMIPNGDITALGKDIVRLEGRSLQDGGKCSTERFAKQSTAAMCSGFLVGENLLVTAGHCIESKRDCKRNKWVFDFKVDTAEQQEVTVPKSNVYSCSKIISRALTKKKKGTKSGGNDYALIQLDRKVTDRRVLDYRRSGSIEKGDNLVVIGHPSGLPTKIADGANVKSLSNLYFSANLDTYGGNSGSAVFNADTGMIEGILVRGAKDYVYNSSKGCYESNEISNNSGTGEDVTYIMNIEELQN